MRLTIKEAARKAGVRPAEVREAIEKGELESSFHLDRGEVIEADDVFRWADERDARWRAEAEADLAWYDQYGAPF